MTTRRSFLSLLGMVPIGAFGLSCRVSDSGSDKEEASGVPRSDAMDEALEMLAPYGASYRGGLSNHGPMTAEALVSLGREDAVAGWVARYRKRLSARPAQSQRVEASQWREALGDNSRSRDWDEFFTNELAEATWQNVVGVWVPRLAPGIAAAGLHGVIRVGHAVCSLRAKDNELRRDELARALSYWASDYLPLPGEYSRAGKLTPSLALKEVELLPSEQRSSRGLITTELKDLRGFEPFAEAIHLVDSTTESSSFMDDLLVTFAGIFVNTNSNSFEFLHAVTGTAAIVELLPHVKPEDRAAVHAYTWQVTAGVFARYARQNLVAEFESGPNGVDPKRLAQLAVASWDEHTIKLVAACTRGALTNSDPRLLAAAAKRVR